MRGVGTVEVCGQCGRANRIPLWRLHQRAVCGACRQVLREAGEPVAVDGAQLRELVATAEVPVLVDFWAAWCGPCRMLAPQLDAVSRRLAGRVIVAKLDVDAAPDAAAQFGARAIPLLVMFRGGQPVWRQTGARSAQQLEREVVAALGAGGAGAVAH